LVMWTLTRDNKAQHGPQSKWISIRSRQNGTPLGTWILVHNNLRYEIPLGALYLIRWWLVYTLL
jgi:hypothetical protein